MATLRNPGWGVRRLGERQRGKVLPQDSNRESVVDEPEGCLHPGISAGVGQAVQESEIPSSLTHPSSAPEGLSRSAAGYTSQQV